MIEIIRQEQNIKRLTLGYWVALGLIGLILTGGEFWVQAEQHRHGVYVSLLEEAERYGGGADRIASAAQDLADTKDSTGLALRLKKLESLRNAFVASHRAFQSGQFLSGLPPEAAGRFSAGISGLEPHYTSLMAAVNAIQDSVKGSDGSELSPASASAFESVSEAYIGFAPALGDVIADFFSGNAAQARKIRMIQMGRLGSTLGLLLLMGYLVFRPAIRRTQEAFANLERTGLALAEARDEALENEGLKSAFLANMSHEIRTPLNGVIGMIEILRKTGLTGQQQEFIHSIESSADSLHHIVEGVLDLAKIEAGRLVLERQEFDLPAAVDAVSRRFSPQARAKKLEFITHLDMDVPSKAVGDAPRFSQVLDNLVDNAIKYTEKGEVFLRVSCPSRTESEAEILVTVSDSGIGIGQQALSRLFLPFNQGDGSLTRRFGGAGLGLALSKQLAGKMNGTIEVRSQPGRGTTSVFRARLGLQEAAGTKPGQDAPKLPQMRILVVDDNPSNIGGLHLQLLSEGLQCDRAQNAATALERIQERVALNAPYNLVILDMQKPEVDGLALARRIRTQRGSDDIRLFLTKPSPDTWERHPDESVIDARIAKPIDTKKLLALILSFGAGKRLAPFAQEVDARSVEPPSPASGARILLVEDNPTNQNILILQLGDFGFKADAVSNGLEAVERLRVAPYDLVLMDCQMPVMDGYQATRSIRQIERAAATPIIALTAHAMNGDREKCLEAGMDDYIAKPVKGEVLKAVIERWLPGGSAESQTAQPVKIESDPPSLDGEVFAQISGMAQRGGEPGELAQLIDSFIGHTQAEIDGLGQCLERGDIAGAKTSAHSIRGSSGFYGAARLSGYCGELEMLAQEGDIEGARKRYKSIQGEATQVAEAMMREISGGRT